jgi:hypothetical protein
MSSYDRLYLRAALSARMRVLLQKKRSPAKTIYTKKSKKN